MWNLNDALAFATGSAATAIDQAYSHDYPTLQDSIDSHRQNLVDTLVEYRAQIWEEEALQAFDDAIRAARRDLIADAAALNKQQNRSIRTMSHNYTAHRIASLLAAISNCRATGNSEWEARHGNALDSIMLDAPHGSGIDSGVILDRDASMPEKLIFLVPFHHMDSNGYYCGWSDYVVTVRASLVHALDIRIRGRDKNGTRDYLADVIGQWLYTEIDANAFAKRQGAAA